MKNRRASDLIPKTPATSSVKKTLTVLVVLILFGSGIKIGLDRIYVAPILMYHSIDNNEDMTKLSLSAKGFSEQMDYLDAKKYNVVSLEEIARLIKSGKKMPPKTISITFDDGYENNFLLAFPALSKHDFPATIFIITDFVGRPGYLTWDQIRVMHKNGISIGSHTASHQWLPDQDDEKLRSELAASKETIEKNTGQTSTILSYPLGAYNARVKKAAVKAGYIAACGTNPGRNSSWRDVYALKRIKISRTSRNKFVFAAEISGYYTFIKER